MEIKHIILAACFLIPLQSVSQEYSYVNYDIRDGLAGSVVYCMVQDHDGFIWFGTETGLSRFDGSRFVNYTVDDGLPDNEIIRLFVDSKNRLWIIPFKNQVCYYKDGRFHTAANDSLVKRIGTKDDVIGIVENNSGQIAIEERYRITTINADNSTETLDIDHEKKSLGTAGLNFDSSFLFLVFEFPFGSSLKRISGKNLVDYEIVDINKSGSSVTTYLGPNLRILSRRDSLLFLSPSNKFWVRAPEGVINMCLLNDSLVAMTALSKTYTYNYRRGAEDRVFFTGKDILSAMEDREGNLWFASKGSGVYRLPSTRFISRTFEDKGNKLQVYSLLKKGNKLLAGTDNFFLWDIDLKNYQAKKNLVVRNFAQGRVTTIDTMPDGRLLLGTDGGLLIGSNDHFRSLMPCGAVKSLFLHRDTIFMAFHAGALAITEFTRPPSLGFFYLRCTAICLYSDSVFIGTLNGVYTGFKDGSQTNMGKGHPALNKRISALKNAPDGTLWIATYGNGLVGYKNGKITAVLTKDSGLTSNIVRALFVSQNAIWIGTDKGLNKAETVNGNYKITRYTTADGLMSDMINTVYVDGNTVHVGTSAGLTSFDEDQVFTRSMCELRLTGLSSAKRQSLTDTGRLFFDHYDSEIRFEFTGISFKSAGEITYWHRLKGLDTGWHSSSDNVLNYPTLPSGNYELELQAENKFGIRSNIMRLRFSVEYLVWERTWFWIASLIFLIALLWIFISFRIRKIRMQEQERLDTSRKIAELEQMALSAQMNPHFIFNSLNSIQHYVFGRDIRGANRFLSEFSKLIRTTMEISGKNRISLEDEIKYLSTYLGLEKRRFGDKFVYSIYLDDSVDPVSYYIPPMILQPYLENSIRHGLRYLPDNNGKLKLEFSIADDYLVCLVEDNGIGRERSRQLKGKNIIEYQSQGMTLTARRIEMMNKNLDNPIIIKVADLYDGTEPAGTMVVVQIPLEEI